MCETEISSRNSEKKQLTSDLENWTEGLHKWKQVDERFWQTIQTKLISPHLLHIKKN